MFRIWVRSSTKWFILLGVGLLIAFVAVLGSRIWTTAYTFNGTALEPPQDVPDIVGVNWDGTPFRLRDLKGNIVLLFFGYTSCPDVCPTTLGEMQTLYTELGQQAAEVKVIFITVDPERDSVERLAQYVPAFNADFLGVYLEPEELEAVKQAYGIYAQKAEYEDNQTAAGYLVDHTAAVSVIDQTGNRRLVFSFGTTAEEMVQDIRYLLGS